MFSTSFTMYCEELNSTLQNQTDVNNKIWTQKLIQEQKCFDIKMSTLYTVCYHLWMHSFADWSFNYFCPNYKNSAIWSEYTDN